MTLSASGLSVSRSGRTILFPTSINIEPGVRIGLVGASGSGKSTLGHALIDALRAQKHKVAHVPQSPDEALDPLRSFQFHWREAQLAAGVSVNNSRQERLFRALSIAQGNLQSRPWGWSRGMQQRFVIAMALIGAPDLIILDEPTSALDPVVAARTMALLQDFLSETPKNNAQTAMLLITHDLGLAAQNVDRLMVMENGRLVEEAPTEDVLNAPRTAAAQSLAAHRSWLNVTC